MIECVQKIWLQGNTPVISLPRRLIFPWGVKPGEFVRIVLDEKTGQGTIERWGTVNVGRSPGVIDHPLEPIRR